MNQAVFSSPCVTSCVKRLRGVHIVSRSPSIWRTFDRLLCLIQTRLSSTDRLSLQLRFLTFFFGMRANTG